MPSKSPDALDDAPPQQHTLMDRHRSSGGLMALFSFSGTPKNPFAAHTNNLIGPLPLSRDPTKTRVQSINTNTRAYALTTDQN